MADWAAGLDLPVGGETVLFCDCEAAFYRTSVPRAVAQILRTAGVEFGLMKEQWCCGGPAAEMGYVDQARRFAEHNVADWRAVGAKRILVIDPHDYISFTEDYPSYFGEDFEFEIVLVVEFVAELLREGKLKLSVPIERVGHLPRCLPVEQAQGDSRASSRDPAGDPGAHLQGRRPRHPMVVLLRARAPGSGSSVRI